MASKGSHPQMAPYFSLIIILYPDTSCPAKNQPLLATQEESILRPGSVQFAHLQLWPCVGMAKLNQLGFNHGRNERHNARCLHTQLGPQLLWSFDICLSSLLHPPVIKHGLLENGPLINDFPVKHLHSVRGFSSQPCDWWHQRVGDFGWKAIGNIRGS